MRRRIGLALIGMVVASLVLTGLGTIALTTISDRRALESDLREQTDALRDIFAEVTLGPSAEGENSRQRLLRLSRTMSLEGIGIIAVPDNSDPIGFFPDGVGVDDLDVDALQAGEVVSGRKGNLVFASAATQSRQGITTLLVLTREPDPIFGPAIRWFLVAGAATVGVAVLVTIRSSRRLIAPVREASDTAARIAEGDLSARIDDHHGAGDDELAELVRSINTMAAGLERSRALERQFLLSVSHDLRTPLTSIRGYAEALTDGAVDDPVAVGEIIESESRRLERLVGDLLLLARLEGTGFEFALAEHDLNRIVTDTLDGLRNGATGRGVAITTRLADPPVRARVDHDRFAQVLANLVSNAMRFAEREVVVTLWSTEGQVHLAVADDGPGIADADLPHVFERLYVAQHNPKIAESGSGLGLAIVKELVEGMQGRVVARRATGGGAEFVVSFWAAPPS